MVVPQQFSELFAALSFAVSWLVGFGVGRKGDDVADPLARAFSVVVNKVLLDWVSEHRLAEEDHPIDALGCYGFDEAFCECVHIRTWRGQFQCFDADRLEDHVEAGRELRVAVADEIATLADQVVARAGEVAADLAYPGLGRVSRDAGDVDLPRADVDEEQDVAGDESERGLSRPRR